MPTNEKPPSTPMPANQRRARPNLESVVEREMVINAKNLIKREIKSLQNLKQENIDYKKGQKRTPLELQQRRTSNESRVLGEINDIKELMDDLTEGVSKKNPNYEKYKKLADEVEDMHSKFRQGKKKNLNLYGGGFYGKEKLIQKLTHTLTDLEKIYSKIMHKPIMSTNNPLSPRPVTPIREKAFKETESVHKKPVPPPMPASVAKILGIKTTDILQTKKKIDENNKSRPRR